MCRAHVIAPASEPLLDMASDSGMMLCARRCRLRGRATDAAETNSLLKWNFA